MPERVRGPVRRRRPAADAAVAAGRRRTWAGVAAVAWAALLYVLSSLPAGSAPSLPFGFPGDDKVVHFGAYAVLGGLLQAAIGRAGPAVALAAAYGAVDELRQASVPGREADVLDWLADLAGAAAGAALVAHLARRGRDRAVE